MIKIIKAPHKNAPQYRIICKRCGTIFECNDSDFREEVVGHGMTDYFVVCPTCGGTCSDMLAPYFCDIKTIIRYNTDTYEPSGPPEANEKGGWVNYGGGPSSSDWF